MTSSTVRSRDRQRLRAEVRDAVAEMPLPYLLEAVAARLDVRDGRLDIYVRDGVLRETTRFGRSFELTIDGRAFPFVGSETFTPDRLRERTLRPSRSDGEPVRR